MTPEQQQVILKNIGVIITAKAKRLCPVDMGQLMSSINWRIEGDSVIIYSDVDYAMEMEFGAPPHELSGNEKDDIADWAFRHNLPAQAVINKIQTNGIEVGTSKNPLYRFGRYRPFLRPAVLQSMPEIKKMIKSVVA